MTTIPAESNTSHVFITITLSKTNEVEAETK
jgi:hypothetical protein